MKMYIPTYLFTYVISDYEARLSKADKEEREMNPAIERATNALKFVAQHVKNEDNFNSYADDWKYVAMVLDRILLWMFTIACVVGEYIIILTSVFLGNSQLFSLFLLVVFFLGQTINALNSIFVHITFTNYI